MAIPKTIKIHLPTSIKSKMEELIEKGIYKNSQEMVIDGIEKIIEINGKIESNDIGKFISDYLKGKIQKSDKAKVELYKIASEIREDSDIVNIDVDKTMETIRRRW